MLLPDIKNWFSNKLDYSVGLNYELLNNYCMHALIKNQLGFSLVQGMIVAGIVAGSGLVATRLITDQKMAQKGAETRDQVDQLHSMVYAVLQNKDHCLATVKGAYSGGVDNSSIVTAPNPPTLPRETRQIPRIVTVGQTNTTATGTSIVTSQTQTVVEVNDGTAAYNAANPRVYMNGNVTVKKMEMTYPGTNGDGFADFAIEYERLNKNENVRTKSGYGAKNIRKVIAIRMQRRPDKDAVAYNNAFEGCYGVTENKADDAGNKDLAKTMCNELNATGDPNAGSSLFEWNESLSTCVPKEHICKGDGMVNTGINSNGIVECRRLEEWTDMNNFIDQGAVSAQPCVAGRTARISINTVTNKVHIECN